MEGGQEIEAGIGQLKLLIEKINVIYTLLLSSWKPITKIMTRRSNSSATTMLVVDTKHLFSPKLTTQSIIAYATSKNPLSFWKISSRNNPNIGLNSPLYSSELNFNTVPYSLKYKSIFSLISVIKKHLMSAFKPSTSW